MAKQILATFFFWSTIYCFVTFKLNGKVLKICLLIDLFLTHVAEKLGSQFNFKKYS